MNNILIVDDHPLYREGMVSALRTSLADVRVTGASSAEDGLEALAASPDTDLVLVDARLPGADGFAALRLYASRFPAVARMMISGFDDPQLVKRAFSAGASGFIHKSMPVAEVVSAIQRVLAGGVFVPDGAGRAAEKHGSAGEEGAAITLRQLEVLRLLRDGCTNKEIARKLDITERTAKAHVAAIFAALDAENRTQAVVTAQRRGLLPDREPFP